MLAGRPDVLEAMAKNGTRLIIIGKDQVYTDMPEYRNSPNPEYQNERVRGTGGLDVTSFGEENLLNLPIDRYDDESIGRPRVLPHHRRARCAASTRRGADRLGETYRNAMAQGTVEEQPTPPPTRPSTGPRDRQSYFDCNRVNNWNHAPIGTREQLKQYDPEGYELVRDNLQPDTRATTGATRRCARSRA